MRRVTGQRHPVATRLAGNAGTLGAGDALVRLLSFVTYVAIARLLGPADVGRIAVATALLAYVGLLGDAGLTVYGQRSLVAQPQAMNSIATRIIVAQLGLAALLTVALAAIAPLLPIDRDTVVLVQLSSPALIAQALNMLYLLQAFERMRAVAAIRVASQLTIATATLATLFLWASPEPVVVVAWAGVLVADVLVLRYARRRLQLRFMATSFRPVVSTLRQGSLYLLGGAVTQVIINFDLLVLGATRPPTDAGVYTAAYRLSFFVSSTIGIAVMATMPELIRRWHQDRLAFERLLGHLLQLSARLGAIVLAAGVLLGPAAIQLFYGSAFHRSQLLFQILLLTVPLGFVNSFLVQAFYAAGRPALYLAVAGTTAATIAIALLISVPRGGPTAAAIIAVAAEFVTLVGARLIAGRLFTVSLGRTMGIMLWWTALPLSAGLVLQWAVGAWAATLLGWLTGVALLEVLGGWPLRRDLMLITGRGKERAA